MTAVLPDTYTVRPPAKEDAEAVLAVGMRAALVIDVWRLEVVA